MHDKRAPATDPPHRPKAAPPPPSPRLPTKALSADDWIIRYHDIWSRLTLSTFYKDLADTSLTQAQYFRWLLDRTSVSISVVKAATRTNEMLRLLNDNPDPNAPNLQLTLETAELFSEIPGSPTSTTVSDAANGAQPHQRQQHNSEFLPLLRAAKDDAHFLAQYAEMSGFDIYSDYRLSHAAKRLTEFIDASTAPDAPLTVAVTAIWTYMLASWTAWALCLNRKHPRPIPPHFRAIGEYLSRKASISHLSDTQDLLDRLLRTEVGARDFDKAGKAFEEVARRAGAVLDHTLYMADGNQVPLCTCGRKGHSPEQCTFKSHF